jgi:hypothetical protein
MVDELKCFYQHYKNRKKYQLILKAIDTTTKEKVAVYQALYEPYEYFVRPWDEFFGIVEYESKQIPRFKRIQ